MPPGSRPRPGGRWPDGGRMRTPIHIGAAGGEYMESVLVTEWRVPSGGQVRAGDVVAVVETAKAATEVEAPCDGFLTSLQAQEGEEIAVGDPIAYVADSAEAASAPPPERQPPAQAAAAAQADDGAGQVAPAATSGGRVLASPAARRLAAARGVDLQRLIGSGPKGRIKLRDIPEAAPEPDRKSVV